MSKTPTDPRDWSEQAESLFRAARAEHEPSAVDRVRVRSALAQRLAGSSAAPGGSDAQASATGTGTSAAALGKLAKICIGVACAMTGAVALMRAGDAPVTERAPPPAPSAPAAEAQRSALAAAAREPAVAVAEPERVAGPRDARDVPAARVAATSAHPAEVGLSSADAAGDLVRRRVAAARPGPATRDPRASASATSPTGTTPAPRDAPESADAPPADLAAAAQSSPDVRAELAFMARIQAAMVESRASEVPAQRQDNSGTRDAAARARRFLASHPRSSLAPRVRDECAELLADD